MHPEALILRRCYPVPVTFADLRAAHATVIPNGVSFTFWRRAHKHINVDVRNVARATVSGIRNEWHAALKRITGAIDEVYAVVDGREVRVAMAGGADEFQAVSDLGWRQQEHIADLMDKADRAGYWERPHEVRLDLSPRPVSHGEVARAVLVGQEALERGGVVRPR